MKCKRCQSSDRLVFIKGIYYCRNCIDFKRVLVNEELTAVSYRHTHFQANYYLDYDLSSAQIQIANQLLTNYTFHKNSIVQAVCGSGKTEIVYKTICHALSKGNHVCFALPRREIAIEIHQRLEQQFRDCSITVVYGGNTSQLEADIVVCTTHQLYRYHQSFNLLIIDEVDAFPFYGNQVLFEIAKQSCCGNLIFLSATMTKQDIAIEAELITLFRRYHNHDLPVPKIKLLPKVFLYFACIYRIKQYRKRNELVLVFVPTIHDCEVIHQIFHRWKLSSSYIHSKTKDKEVILSAFREGLIDVLITTTLLERGVTFANLQVIVLYSNHIVFNKATLIQIAGRVGRKIEYPKGDVIFYAQKISKAMKQCIKEIKKMNAA